MRAYISKQFEQFADYCIERNPKIKKVRTRKIWELRN